MRILLVEDDRRSREFLTRGLTEEGYTVDPASDGEEALELLRTRAYDLITLDVMLPRLDGWGVVRELRKFNKSVPVLFLTARDTVSDRVRGLELGADDYLVKPFAWAEFIARIKTLLRRGPGRPSDELQIADLTLDLAKMKARRGGTSSPMSIENTLSASRASSMLTKRRNRRVGSMVVSHSCSAFISPKPLYRCTFTESGLPPRASSS